MNPLFTIGHSDLQPTRFCSLLQANDITALADVRSQPYSRHFPQFNRETLEHTLASLGVRYVFLGKELGARRDEPECYVGGQARYEMIATTPAFAEGLTRLKTGLQKHRIALMCAEHDPTTCHRMVLVCRALRDSLIDIRHILRDGVVETNAEAEARMLQKLGVSDEGIRIPSILEQAYRRQGLRIAFTDEEECSGESKITTTEQELHLG